MPFPNITNLRRASVTSANYFVDANVWIYSLQKFEDLEHWENSYYQFFFDIVDSTLDPQPKIILPTLLISEIVNTYLRKFAIPEYKLENGIADTIPFEFKRDYRPTQHYTDSFEKIMDDIQSLHASIKFYDDGLVANDQSILLNKSIGQFDYNDYLYYSLCKELNKSERVIMLTNDGDFQVTDFEIITSNRTLLSL
jgi:predicted nucleic acid-binding protein